METDIEKLQEAAFKLAEIATRNSDDVDEWNDAIAAVEAFKPEPEKPIDRWVNVYPNDVCIYTYLTKEIAVKNSAEGLIRTAHLREVVPVEWVEWVLYDGHITSKNGRLIYALPTIQEICAAHNAEMEKVTGTKGK